MVAYSDDQYNLFPAAKFIHNPDSKELVLSSQRVTVFRGQYTAPLCVTMVKSAPFIRDFRFHIDNTKFMSIPPVFKASLGETETCGIIGTKSDTRIQMYTTGFAKDEDESLKNPSYTPLPRLKIDVIE